MQVFRIIVLLLIIILVAFLRIFLIYKSSGIKGIGTFFKALLIGILCAIIISVLYNFLPKYEVGIEFVIKNENTIVEMNINGDFFNIDENENTKNIYI